MVRGGDSTRCGRGTEMCSLGEWCGWYVVFAAGLFGGEGVGGTAGTAHSELVGDGVGGMAGVAHRLAPVDSAVVGEASARTSCIAVAKMSLSAVGLFVGVYEGCVVASAHCELVGVGVGGMAGSAQRQPSIGSVASGGASARTSFRASAKMPLSAVGLFGGVGAVLCV